MAVVEAFLEILRMPISWAMMIGIIQFWGPVWIPFLLGVMVGWIWKPRWATLGNCKFDFSAPPSPSALFKGLGLAQNLDSCKGETPICRLDDGLQKELEANPTIDSAACSPSETGKEDLPLITDEDLEHLCHLVERKDGGPPWKHMMDRSAQNMSYQAWQRDPQNGPPQYCSTTVYEDATPELLRDFFWDDSFRLTWDDMLTHTSILQECPTTGTIVVRWIRKFPFFCSDREYIIGRRIWESGRSYYCVTKGVPSSVPKQDKPRRVDLFYSSWFIRAVESRKNEGQLSACEVILFHHEDMGIPWEIAKFGVRQGMWGAVKNIDRGFRAYQKHRAAVKSSLSRHAFMAQINTKLDPDYLRTLEDDQGFAETPLVAASNDDKGKGSKIPKLLIIGGAIAVACSLDRGLLTKTLIFWVANKFGSLGGRACNGSS